MANRFETKYGCLGVIGVVYGTQIGISVLEEDPQAYINRKGFNAMQAQV